MCFKRTSSNCWKHSIMVNDCFCSIIYSTFQPESFIESYHKAIHGSAIYFPGGISWKCITTLPDALQPSPTHHRPFEWPDNGVAMSIREESGGLRGRPKNMGVQETGVLPRYRPLVVQRSYFMDGFSRYSKLTVTNIIQYAPIDSSNYLPTYLPTYLSIFLAS